MNIQLFLEGNEVELTNNIVFPLNKTFENLENPTDIVVEYSKSVNIPMTQRNNILLGQLYNISRTILDGGSQNIGMHLDPNKRIPFRLIFNGKLVLSGYAKFLSAYYSTKNKYYTLNLYGVLGDVFHKLKEVVVDESQLAEGQDSTYVLDDQCDGDVVNAEFVKDCWNVDDPTFNLPDAHDWEILGMAPAYRGYNPNFKSDQRIQTSGGLRYVSFVNELTEAWRDRYSMQIYGVHYVSLTDNQKSAVDKYVDALDPDGAIGEGLKDYQYKEYRSYHQRPFIYFNKLMQMYQDKCLELTGYQLTLDPSWFSISNPYWTRSCYMFDYLESEGVTSSDRVLIAPAGKHQYINKISSKGAVETFQATIPTNPANVTRLDLGSFNLYFHHYGEYSGYDGHDPNWHAAQQVYDNEIKPEFRMSSNSKYEVKISAMPTGGSTWETHTFWTAQYPAEAAGGIYTTENYFELEVENSYETKRWFNALGTNITVKNAFDAVGRVPACSFTGDYSNGGSIKVEITAVNPTDSHFLYIYVPVIEHPHDTRYFFVDIDLNSNNHTVTEEQLYGVVTNQNAIRAHLKNFYKKEDPLFNVILEYTKMFGLIWDVDYERKIINLVPKGKYFSDYTITNWDNKLDKSKDYIVEPVVFPSKYIEFNYDEVDGYRYTNYSDKYGVEYGAKKVKTNYEFNTENEKIFDGINPSISSNRNVIYFKQLLNWNLSSTITATPDPYEKMECATEEDDSSLSISNWYLRGKNVEVDDPDMTITDDCTEMLVSGTFCYYDKVFVRQTDPILQVNYMPVFSAVYKDEATFLPTSRYYGMLFNQPQEDYTTSKLYTAAGNRFIYDLCWSSFINERYNSQNKKLTAYFHLSPSDYFDFKFNHFVVLQDQLFCVNKIFDYSMNETDATKVELIQISDPKKYADMSNLFAGITISPTAYYNDNCAASGTIHVYVRTESLPNYELVIDEMSGSSQSMPNVIVEDVENLGDGWFIFVLTYSNFSANSVWGGRLVLTLWDYEAELPIYLAK